MTYLHRMAAWAVVALLGLAAIGCSKGDANRSFVSGTVTYQGRPIAKGQIVFLPTGGTAVSSTGATITDGHYQVDSKGGVPVGSFTVKIFAYRDKANGPGSAGEVVGGADQPQEQYLPAKYNEKSELTLTVKPNEPQLTHDFALP